MKRRVEVLMFGLWLGLIAHLIVALIVLRGYVL